MQNTTFVTISEATDQLSWISTDEHHTGNTGVQTGNIEQLAEDISSNKLIVLVPTSLVTITIADVPKTAISKLRQAIPYAIEEELASPIEDLHFALGNWEDAGLAVAIVQEQRLANWLARFQQHKFNIEALLPSAFALDYQENCWSMYITAEQTLLRVSAQVVLYIDTTNLETLLRALINSDQFSAPEKVMTYNPDAIDLSAIEKFHLDLEQQENPPKLLELAIKNITSIPTINLLQGDFKPKHKKSVKQKQWQLAGILAGLWLAVLIFGNLGQYIYYSTKADKLNKQTLALYQQVLPGQTDLTNAKINVTNELKNLILADEGSPFLRLMGSLGDIWKSDKQLTVTELNYQNNKITMQITMPSFADLDQLSSQLKNRGLTVQQSNVRTAGKQIQAQLDISG